MSLDHAESLNVSISGSECLTFESAANASEGGSFGNITPQAHTPLLSLCCMVLLHPEVVSGSQGG